MGKRDAVELVWRIIGAEKMVLTVSDMALVSGESEKTIRRRVDAGEIRSSTGMDGRGIRIPIAEALSYCLV